MTNDASIIWSNGGEGCGVSSGVCGSGGVDGIVAQGPQGVLKQYFPHEWMNRPLVVVASNNSISLDLSITHHISVFC